MLVKISAAVGTQAEEAIAQSLLIESPGGIAIEEIPGAILVSAFVPVERVERVRKMLESKISELRSFGLDVGPGLVSVEAVDEREWAIAYRESFHTVKIGRIIVRPSWEIYRPAPDEIVIELDPGLAFGTGSHPTTKGCLMALQKHVKRGWIAVDIGTGSGILAIAAAKLGASRVIALDVDPVAVEVARRNARANGVEGVLEVIEGDVEAIKGRPIDLAVANLTAPDISGIVPVLAEDLRGLKVAIFSGILKAQAAGIEKTVSKCGFAIEDELMEDDWVTVVGRRA